MKPIIQQPITTLVKDRTSNVVTPACSSTCRASVDNRLPHDTVPRTCQPSSAFVHPHAATRRLLLFTGVSYLTTCLTARHTLAAPVPTLLRSKTSDKPAVLTVANNTSNPLKLYWLNFDGDSEFFVSLPAGASWTVDTFEGHPWRIVDAASGKTVQTYTATAGEQVLRIGMLTAVDGLSKPAESMDARRSPRGGNDGGFDGIGGTSSAYASAQLADVLLSNGAGQGAVVLIQVDGFALPLSIFIGVPEAMSIVYSNGMDFRRPPTIDTWTRSLMATGAVVERVLITRMVGTTFYARIVLKLPDGSQRSIDSRPSDAVALALQAKTPMFVSKTVAQEFEDWVTMSDIAAGTSQQGLSASMPADGAGKRVPPGSPRGSLQGPHTHTDRRAPSLPMRPVEGDRSI